MVFHIKILFSRGDLRFYFEAAGSAESLLSLDVADDRCASILCRLCLRWVKLKELSTMRSQTAGSVPSATRREKPVR